MRVHLDLPEAGSLCDPLCLRIEGWLLFDPGDPTVTAVEFLIDGEKAGETACLTPRSDVASAWKVTEDRCRGFLHFAHVGTTPWGETSRLEIRIRPSAGPASVVPAPREIRWARRDHRKNHYGVLLDPANVTIFRRENVYGSGPSQPGGDAELLELLRRHLGPPPRRVLDVGCGLGWYGEALRRDGHDWLGVEVKESDCAKLAQQGLPHQRVDGRTLPFANAAFDAAMAIEVLEHTEDPRAFLGEIRRVAPRRLLVSVPNIELIPYLQDYLAVPWHLLEADHKNFFTRWSLGALLREFYPRVEVLCYHRHPLAAVEGSPLYYHLFAVAWNPA